MLIPHDKRAISKYSEEKNYEWGEIKSLYQLKNLNVCVFTAISISKGFLKTCLHRERTQMLFWLICKMNAAHNLSFSVSPGIYKIEISYSSAPDYVIALLEIQDWAEFDSSQLSWDLTVKILTGILELPVWLESHWNQIGWNLTTASWVGTSGLQN